MSVILWIIVGALVLFLIGFEVWTDVILYKQKKAWKAYAAKAGLTYESGKLKDSPVIYGKIKPFNVRLYTDVKPTPRGQRLVPVIEIELGEGLPTGAAIASPEMRPFVDQLVFDIDYKPDFQGWDSSLIVRTRNEERLQPYLTPERLKVLQTLFAMKNSVVLFFFDELEAVLRIETSDPMSDPVRLEKLVNQFYRICVTLALTEEEKQAFNMALHAEEIRKAEEKKQREAAEAAEAAVRAEAARKVEAEKIAAAEVALQAQEDKKP